MVVQRVVSDRPSRRIKIRTWDGTAASTEDRISLGQSRIPAFVAQARHLSKVSRKAAFRSVERFRMPLVLSSERGSQGGAYLGRCPSQGLSRVETKRRRLN